MHDSDGLRADKRELGDYARSHMTLMVSWYTVFLTANMAGIGFVSSDRINPRLAGIVAAFAMVESLLAIVPGVVLIKELGRLRTREYAILKSLEESRHSALIPVAGYRIVTVMMMVTFVILFFTWLKLFMSVRSALA